MLYVLKRLVRHRSLLVTLTRRELAARYRGSTLGFLWSLVNPLLLLIVYSLVFSVIFQPRDEAVVTYGPYALFLATGVIPWIWIQTAWLEGANSLLANAGLIRKAAFPAEILPVVSVLANLFHLVLALPILALAFVVTGFVVPETTAVTFEWTAVFLPCVVLLQVPMVIGVSLATAALNVHFKDVRDILQNLLTLLFFATPILYTLRTVENFPPVWWAIRVNPFTGFTLAYQEATFFGRAPSLWLWLEMGLVSALFLSAGCWLFHRLSETLVEAV
ncbi:MAG: ABC transporter permease [Thermoanaerobaculia bacterium]|nr:ABC transporter permease [Thermoanaerobaculia bacterium]